MTPNRVMETTLLFGRNPEARDLKDFLVEKFNVSDRAEDLFVSVDLKTGDIIARTMFPSPIHHADNKV